MRRNNRTRRRNAALYAYVGSWRRRASRRRVGAVHPITFVAIDPIFGGVSGLGFLLVAAPIALSGALARHGALKDARLHRERDMQPNVPT